MFGSLLLGEIRKCYQRVSPHGIDVGTQLGEALRVEMKIVSGAASFFRNQAGGFQHLKMLRYRRTADGKLASQFTHCGWAPAQQVDQCLASTIRKGS